MAGKSQSNNQAPCMLFSVGEHDLPCIRISVHLSLLLVSASLLVHPTSFHAVFPCCVFLRSFQLSQYILVSLSSLHDQKRLLGVHAGILLMSDFAVSDSCTSVYCLISLQSMRRVRLLKLPSFLLSFLI